MLKNSKTTNLRITGNLQVSKNDEFELPVKVSGNIELGAYQIFLNLPANVFEITGVAMNSAK